MTIAQEAVRLAKLGWPPRLIRRELNIGSDRCFYYLEDARRAGEIGPSPKGYHQNGSIPLKVDDDDLRHCLDLSKVLGISPREVAELGLRTALQNPALLATAVEEQREAS